MKHLFIILTLVFISTSTDAISCIDAKESIQLLNNFQLGAVQQAINDLAVNNIYDKCLVQIRFLYHFQSIEISFGPAFESSVLETNREVRLDLRIRLASDKTILNPARTDNTAEFACDYADECDRRFLLSHLEWLFNAKYDKLESAVRPLLTADIENTGSCINYKDNKEQLCSDGMCHLAYEPLTNLIEGQCINETSAFTHLVLTSKIITDEDMYETEEQDQDIQSQLKIAKLVSRIEYLCLPNNCNNQIIAESITNVVKEHYNISAMYEVLKVKIEEEHTTTSNGKSTISHAPDVTSTKKTTLLTTTSSTNIIITTVSTITTTKQSKNTTTSTTTTTTKQSNNTSTSLHISIILIILNALLFLFN